MGLIFCFEPALLGQIGLKTGVVERHGGEIGPDVERASVGGADHVEWPAPLPIQLERRLHVDLIDVGAFFAIFSFRASHVGNSMTTLTDPSSI